MEMYDKWRRSPQGRRSVVLRGNTWADTTFNIPILPGDSSLLERRISHLHRVLQERLPDEVEKTHFELAFEPGSVLLRLVILRVYLGRSSLSDQEIFDLVCAECIYPVPTEWQKAAQALFGVSINTGSETDSDAGYGPGTAAISDLTMRLEHHIARRITPSDILEGCVEIRTTSGEPYAWTGSVENQLSGGPPFSAFRPRPKAAKKSKRDRDDGAENDGESSQIADSQVSPIFFLDELELNFSRVKTRPSQNDRNLQMLGLERLWYGNLYKTLFIMRLTLHD